MHAVGATLSLITLYLYISYSITDLSYMEVDGSVNNSNNTLLNIYKIPNIVHFIWFSPQSTELKFINFLSILSAHKHIKPDKMYFHTNCTPHGLYWDRIVNKITVMKREPKMSKLIHSKVEATFDCDYERLAVLQEHGGIYLDLDVLVIRPMDDLRKFHCVIGRETENLCNSIFICSKTSLFLKLLMQSFVDDLKLLWAYHSSIYPTQLARRNPHLIHIEETTLLRPNWQELDHIIGPRLCKWRTKYTLHTYPRSWHSYNSSINWVISAESIKKMDSTFGQVARYIYYGNDDLIL